MQEQERRHHQQQDPISASKSARSRAMTIFRKSAAAGAEREQADRAVADAPGRGYRAAGDAAPGLGRAMADAFGGGCRALDGSLDRPGGISRDGKAGNEKCCESGDS